MTDQKTPGYFRAARENKVIPVSPMSSKKTSWLIGQDSFELVAGIGGVPKYGLKYSGYVRGDKPSVKVAWPTVDSNAAAQEALSRAQTDCWDALTWAAEFRKTVESISVLRGRFDRLADTFTRKVEHINDYSTFVDLGGGVSKVSKLWLELRYAWRPMLYDIADIQEAIRRLMKGIEDPLQRAYASRQASVSDNAQILRSGFTSAGGNANLAGFNMLSSLILTRTVEAHASVGVQATTRDISMADPFVTIWEEVPFSFIFDWFVSINNILAAFSPFATGTLRYATIATTSTHVEAYTYMPIPAVGYTFIGPGPRPVTVIYEEQTYSRVANPSLTPTVEFKLDLNAAKVLDLVALWISRDRSIQTRLNRAFNHLTRKFAKRI